MCSCESLKTSGRLLRRSIGYLRNAIKSNKNLKTFRSERSGLWEGRIFHPKSHSRCRAAQKPVANGSAGGSFESYKLPRRRRNPPRLGEQGATREHGPARNAHGREWLSGMNNSPEGPTVTT